MYWFDLGVLLFFGGFYLYFCRVLLVLCVGMLVGLTFDIGGFDLEFTGLTLVFWWVLVGLNWNISGFDLKYGWGLSRDSSVRLTLDLNGLS